MKMKKYIAPSMAEAMKKIRADLGEDAVIFNSKVVVTKKFLGLIRHKNFQVVGIDQIEKKPTLPSLQNIQSLSNSYRQDKQLFRVHLFYQMWGPQRLHRRKNQHCLRN